MKTSADWRAFRKSRIGTLRNSLIVRRIIEGALECEDSVGGVDTHNEVAERLNRHDDRIAQFRSPRGHGNRATTPESHFP